MKTNSRTMALFCAAVFLAVCTHPLTGAAASALPGAIRQHSFITEDEEAATPYKPKRLRIADELETEDLKRGKLSYYGNKLLRYSEDKPAGWPDFHEELLLVHPRQLPVLSANTSDIRISADNTKANPDNILVRRVSPPYDDNTAGIYLPPLVFSDTGSTVYPVSTVPYGFEDGTIYSSSSETPADPRILNGLQFIMENAPPYKSYCCYPGDYEAASRAAAALAIRAYIRWCTAGKDGYDSFGNLSASDSRTFPPDYFAYLYFLYEGAIAAADNPLSSGTNVIFLESNSSPDLPVLVMLGELSGVPAEAMSDAKEAALEISDPPESGEGEDCCQLTVRTIDTLSGKLLPRCEIILRYDSEDYASAVTDENGEAVFPDLPAGKYQLVQKNRLKGYLDPAHTYEISLTGESASERVCMMNIPKSGMLYIFATDSVTGEPVEDAVFRILEKKQELFTFLTDEEGFAYGYLPTGKYAIVCDPLPEGYETLRGPDTVTIRRDEDTETNYVFTRKKKEPIVNLITYYVITRNTMQASNMTTRKLILFSAKRLNRTKTAVAIRTSIRNMLSSAKNGGKNGLRLFEGKNGRFQNQVPEKASEGQKTGSSEIEAYPVSVCAADQATGDNLSGVYIRILAQDGSSAFFYTNEDNLDVSNLLPGEYEAQIILVPEYYTVPNRTVRFSVGEDGVITGETEFLLEKVSVIVTAEDENGNTLSGVAFDMTETSTGTSRREFTDGSGTAIFRPVPFGNYLITEIYPAAGYDLNPARILLHVDGATGSLPVPVATLVSSRNSVICEVFNRTKPVRNAEIILTDACGSILQQAYTDPTGQAVLYGIPCGSYTVTVRSTGVWSTDEITEALLIRPDSGPPESIRFVLKTAPE